MLIKGKGKEIFLRVIVAIFNDDEDDFYKDLLLFLKKTINDPVEEIYISIIVKTPSFMIDRMKRTVIDRNNQSINLTSKEFDLLYFLASHKDQVFSKEQLYEQVWSYVDIPDSRNLTSFIRKLRKKIEKNPSKPKHIITVWGIGYKFTDNE